MLHYLAVKIQKVEIERPGRIRAGTHSPQFSFYVMQKRQKFNRLKDSLQESHGIDKNRIGRVWPGRGFIKGRNPADFHAFAIQLAQRVLQRGGWRADGTG